jgi:hypothetical protein
MGPSGRLVTASTRRISCTECCACFMIHERFTRWWAGWGVAGRTRLPRSFLSSGLEAWRGPVWHAGARARESFLATLRFLQR